MKGSAFWTHIGPGHVSEVDGESVARTPLANAATATATVPATVSRSVSTSPNGWAEAEAFQVQDLKENVLYLGHIVSAQGVVTNPGKIEAIGAWKSPPSVKELQAFLGTTGYYIQYVDQCATIA